MEPFRDGDLTATLRSLRPAPRPAFAAALDERASAGFPRRPAHSPRPLSRLLARLRAASPRRLLLAGGATALAAIAAVTIVVAVNQEARRSNLVTEIGRLPSPPARSDHRQAEFEASGPSHPILVNPARASAAGAASAESAREAGAGALGQRAAAARPRSFNGNSAYATSQPLHRDIERGAEITLGAAHGEVGKDAARAFEAVHANRGIVLSSSINESEVAEIGARFNLLIPSAKLNDVLAAISEIATVRSRRQSTADITAPTLSLGERLRDARAKIEGLLAQLAASDTDAAREATEAELRAARRHSAALRSQFAALRRRASFSNVLVLIETGGRAGSAGGRWDAGDALHDAGRILSIAAGVVIVGLAVIAPVALIALLAWLAHRAWLRRRRERALG